MKTELKKHFISVVIRHPDLSFNVIYWTLVALFYSNEGFYESTHTTLTKILGGSPIIVPTLQMKKLTFSKLNNIAKWCNNFGKPSGGSSRRLNMELLYDPAVSLLGICLREMKTCVYKNLHINVHSSIIHNSQKAETTQIRIWMEK